MPTDVVMPQMGESIVEGTITKWLKKPGDKVQRDEPLFEISTDKVDAEIPAPASGVLKEIKVNEGTTVGINTVVGVIDEAGGNGAGAAPPKQQAEVKQEAKQEAPAGKPTQGATQQQPPKPQPQADGTTQPPQTSAPQAQPTEQTSAPKQDGGGAAAGPGTDVIMPQMGESIFEGTLTKWLKNVGDKVERDEPLFEISTDKVDAEIPAPAAGLLTEIKVPAGSTVQVNSVVGVIGGAAGAAKPAAQAPAAKAEDTQGKATAPAARPSAEGETEVSTTDKPKDAAVKALEQKAVQQQKQTLTDIPAAEDRVRSSPLVRRIAKEHNVDVMQVPGTGLGGRVTKDDILGFIQKYPAGAPAPQRPTAQPQAQPQQPAAGAPAPRPAAPAGQPSPFMEGELVPMSTMRKKIAERMVESKRTSAHVHTVFKIDMTKIERIRQKQKASFEQRNGVKLTYLPFIARAVMAGIREMPIINASVEGDAIRYHKHVNLGIAVALDWGLIVPVLKQAEEKSFVGLARGFVDLANRARSKKLQPDEVAGGTFTITNPGIFGPQFGTPIIPQPQVAIVSMGGLFKEPVVVTDEDGNDSIAIRSIIRLSLGFDHRIIDGADADKFMVAVRKFLQEWAEDIG